MSQRLMSFVGLVLIIGAFTLGLAWWSSASSASAAKSVKAVKVMPTVSMPAARSSSDTSHILGAPSVSADFMNKVLAYYDSPAQGEGGTLYEFGRMYGIDPVFALAFFFHESTLGLKGAAVQTKSIGNIICTPGYGSCIGRFRSYANWGAGAIDWYRLIRLEYVPKGLDTVEKIIPVYAPSVENDVSAYIAAVEHAVACWRSGQVEVS